MNKTYLITGASRGIGKAIAQTLLEQGNDVWGIARSFEWEAPRFHPYTMDMSDLKMLPSALSALKKVLPSPDGLICCCGKGRFGSLEEFSYQQIRELMELNFLSQVYLVKEFIPQLKQKKAGDVLVIGSEAALAGKREGSLYCATKFALRGFCQALREECASSSVRITLINPGMVKTSFFDSLSFCCGDEPDAHLLPEDVAEAALLVLNARPGAVFDEINLSPQKRKIQFKKSNCNF